MTKEKGFYDIIKVVFELITREMILGGPDLIKWTLKAGLKVVRCHVVERPIKGVLWSIENIL